jgi:hypothetical protein
VDGDVETAGLEDAAGLWLAARGPTVKVYGSATLVPAFAWYGVFSPS